MSIQQTDIVIPCHNALEYVKECVRTVEEKTENFRFIFVDDFSQRDTTDFLLSVLDRHPRALLIRTGLQRWFTRAINLGLRLVRTDKCVLLNSDCVVDSGWLEELYSIWEELSSQGCRVGVVGSTLSGDEQRRYHATIAPNYVTGHCWLVSIAALSELSCTRGTPGIYFDETKQDQIHINSERIACYELNKLGYATVASFKSAVGHHFAKSWGANLGRVMSLRLQDVD